MDLESAISAARSAIDAANADIAALADEIDKAEEKKRREDAAIADARAWMSLAVAKADALVSDLEQTLKTYAAPTLGTVERARRKDLADIKAHILDTANWPDLPSSVRDALANGGDLAKAEAHLAKVGAEVRRCLSAYNSANTALKKATAAFDALKAGLSSGADPAKVRALMDAADAAVSAVDAKLPALADFDRSAEIVKSKADAIRQGVDAARLAFAAAMAQVGSSKPAATSQSTKAPLQNTHQFPADPSSLKVVRGLGGSTGAQLVEDADGHRYVLKRGNSADHIRSECAADAAYRALGVNVPEFHLYDDGSGNPVKLSVFVENSQTLGDWMASADKKQRDAMVAKLREDFAVDCALCNWDVLGQTQDNILVDDKGVPWRIDNGGALGFRAQGAAKSAADWADGWPDDLWSMRTSSYNRKMFGDVRTAELTHEIMRRDWTVALSALSPSDKAVMLRRLDEIKQLDVRAVDFEADQYIPDVVEDVLTDTFKLSKEGFREAVPKTITQYDLGFCRPQGHFGLQSNPGGLPDFSGIITSAAKTINKHIGTGDFSPTSSYIDDALKQKTQLEKLAKTDANAKTLLGFIHQIEASQANGWHDKIGMVPNVSVAPQNVPPSVKKYTSLTDMLYQFGKANGVDVERASDMFRAQGGSSWSHDAQRLKILQLASRGKNWNPPPYDGDVWYGSQNAGNGSTWKSIAEDYQKNPDKMSADIKSLSAWKSASTLIMENADFAGNDRKKRTVFVVRTEGLDQVKGLKVGEISKAYSMGPEESFSVFKSVTPEAGTHVTLREVPYSRVSGIYFMSKTPGGDDLFHGDYENEIGIDATGIPVMYAGDLGRGVTVIDHKAAFDAAMKRFTTT